MPAGTAHTVKADEAVLSDEQYEALRSMLEAQHERLAGLLKPIHDIAILLLADHAGAEKPKADKTDKKD